MTRLICLLFCLPAAVACGSFEPEPIADAGRVDAGVLDAQTDAGSLDAGAVPDAGPVPEACAPQEILPFLEIGALAEGRESHVVAQLNQRLLLLGGWSGRGATRSIDTTDGADLTDWSRSINMLAGAKEHHGLTVHSAAVCIIGGDDGRTISTEVLCADRAGPNELSGDWTSAEPLPEPRTGHETVQVGDFVFVLGGVDVIQGASKDTVFRARFGVDGRPSDWTEARVLPTALTFGAAAAANGRIYFAGGVDGRSALSGVLAADVSADGTLGPWARIVELPDVRIGATATIFGNHLWLIGGVGRSGPTDTVFAWPILDDRGLGARLEAPALPATRFGHATVALQDRLLVIGGWQTTSTPPTSTVIQAACP